MNMLNWRVFSMLTLAMLSIGVFTGSVNAENLTVRDVDGDVAVPVNPAKVVVFDLASLDTLSALGVDVAGVPGGNKPPYLKQYEDERYAKVGTVFEPDFEAVAALEPDLIIVGGRSGAKKAELSKLATTINLSVNGNSYFADAKNNILTLGKIFAKTEQAESIVSRLDQAAAELRSKTATAGTGLLVLTTGGKMSTFGAGSRFGILFGDYGVRPADDNVKVGLHGQPATFEYILEKNPDWLYVIDRDAAIGRDGAAAKQVLDNEIVQQTAAYQAGHVVLLNPTSWYSVGGGATSLKVAIDQLTAAHNH